MLTPLERRIIDISYKKGLSHIGSCLTAVGLIDEIFAQKGFLEPFILSNGHAGLALYVVLEKYGYGDAEELFDIHGVHPNTDRKHGIYCSSGSLGHGIGIAVGMALADRKRNVYVMISDGECAEGSVWESLRIIKEQEINNIYIAVSANGYGATSKIDLNALQNRINQYVKGRFPINNMSGWPEYLQGLQGHYHILTKEEYDSLVGQ